MDAIIIGDFNVLKQNGVICMKYWYESRFVNRKDDSGNRATVYDKDDLNEVTSWDINEMGQNMAEA